PVWSRSNIFGHGVPFRFPSSPDTGDGLTDFGQALIRRCNEMHVLIDLSHINEKGFWDIAKLSGAPLVATHSNAHALCPASRNLTNKQLAAIRETGGLVGVNYAVSFLRKDGRRDADTPLDTVVDHIAYLIEHLGEDGVGLGSDFDGDHDSGWDRVGCWPPKSRGGHAQATVQQAAGREELLREL